MDTVPYNFVDAVIDLFPQRTLKRPLAENVNNTIWKDVIQLHYYNRRNRVKNEDLKPYFQAVRVASYKCREETGHCLQTKEATAICAIEILPRMLAPDYFCHERIARKDEEAVEAGPAPSLRGTPGTKWWPASLQKYNNSGARRSTAAMVSAACNALLGRQRSPAITAKDFDTVPKAMRQVVNKESRQRRSPSHSVVEKNPYDQCFIPNIINLQKAEGWPIGMTWKPTWLTMWITYLKKKEEEEEGKEGKDEEEGKKNEEGKAEKEGYEVLVTEHVSFGPYDRCDTYIIRATQNDTYIVNHPKTGDKFLPSNHFRVGDRYP
ncbi:hypothetical protein QR680_014121 [Steinernema hermaphroditum]|uniref:Uncharacterized protein n=1 Tax=Steinernema hermaphroditum TaxID=289476 RepID=A0AA39I7R8_9BILA|nr:hypothetical protein QR680_014121 [Steinernema hermaphroditum]